jgi:hypothetical protein
MAVLDRLQRTSRRHRTPERLSDVGQGATEQADNTPIVGRRPIACSEGPEEAMRLHRKFKPGCCRGNPGLGHNLGATGPRWRGLAAQRTVMLAPAQPYR